MNLSDIIGVIDVLHMNTLINAVFTNQEISYLNLDSISDSYLINQF